MKNINVKKMNGTLAPYSERKLVRSLKKAGASQKTINKITEKVSQILYDKIPTKELFRFAFSELRKEDKTVSSRYNIKNALINLRLEGGYVFEKFTAKLLKSNGYEVKLNQIIQGKYITHEIDVVAVKQKEKLMVECKHHGKPWLGTKIQAALYTYARFLDAKEKFTAPMLVTNTKFSSQVIKYANGVGLKLMGWNYPKGNSLESNILKFNLYPITTLNLPKQTINKCLEKNILTVEEYERQTNFHPRRQEHS